MGIQKKLSNYRKMGKQKSYPKWALALKKKSGCYVIRHKLWEPFDLDYTDIEYLYVGESHSNKLYETLTRHFQSWSGETAGPTFNRKDVEVAVLICGKNEAVDFQDALLAELNPKLNKYSTTKDEDDDFVPF